jgi:hypothetical protein
VVRWTPASEPTVTRTAERSGARAVVAVAIPAGQSLRYDVEFFTTPAR